MPGGRLLGCQTSYCSPGAQVGTAIVYLQQAFWLPRIAVPVVAVGMGQTPSRLPRRYRDQPSSQKSDQTSTLSRINLGGEKQALSSEINRVHAEIANMAANTMSVSSQVALTARSGSSKPFTGQPIKPARAVTLPRSRSHIVKASAQVFYQHSRHDCGSFTHGKRRVNSCGTSRMLHANAQHAVRV